jgi:tetratricopeptide (TPR) repeat protein
VQTSLRVYGPDATYVAYAETTTGDVLVGLRRYEDATPHFETAIGIHERTGTRGDSDYADALRGLGIARLRAGRAAEARTLLEKALAAAPASSKASAEDAGIVAGIESALAEALWVTGTRGERVATLASDAVATYRRAHWDLEADETERWLTAHHPS